MVILIVVIRELGTGTAFAPLVRIRGDLVQLKSLKLIVLDLVVNRLYEGCSKSSSISSNSIFFINSWSLTKNAIGEFK